MPLKLFDKNEETIPPYGEDRSRRKRLVYGGLSAASVVSALVAFGPGACNTVVGFVEMKKDVEQLRAANVQHEKEHDRLRDWIRRISARSKLTHGWIPEGTEDGAEDAEEVQRQP